MKRLVPQALCATVVDNIRKVEGHSMSRKVIEIAGTR